MIDLSIIIVSYNTREFTKRCIESIFDSKPKISFEVIVVDNASADGTVELLRKSSFAKRENVKIIANDKNLGFSKANNVGLRHSEKSKYKLFLNPDTVMNTKTLDYVFSFMEKNARVGAATCKVLIGQDKIDDATHRGFPTPWNAFCHFSGISKLAPNSKLLNGYYLGWCDLDKTHPIDALAGAFMFTRAEAGEDAGWWDEDYFFYGEDVDFCYMLKKKGWKVYYVAEVSVFHYKGVAGGIRKESEGITTATIETKKRVTNWRFNAMKIFYKKHYINKYPFFVTALVFLAVDLRRFQAMRKLEKGRNN